MRYILFAFVIFVASCNDTNSTNQNTAEGTKNSSPPACYAFFTEKDTIIMRLEVRGDVITGNLAYDFFEKDDNNGTLEGKVKGDTIFATYRFMSEGTYSEREVAFLKKGHTFVEGYGERTERDGKIIFKDKQALDFDSNTILAETECL